MVALQPFSPGSANIPRQNELIPQINQFIDSNQSPNVVFIALTENLLFHTGALWAIGNTLPLR
jgi:hypothetical protein